MHRIRKYLGAYLLNLNLDVHAIVFSGGIGEHSERVRSKVCGGLDRFGIALNDKANNSCTGNCSVISEGAESSIDVLVVPTDEELCIARDTVRLAGIGS